MVNEEFVRKYLKGADPLQQRVMVEELIPGVTKLGPAIAWQIVGVFHNVRDSLRKDNPEMLIPFWQVPWPGASFGVRTSEDPGAMTKSIAAAVHKVDPEVALATPRTMDQVRDDVLANDRFTLILFVSFAAIALLLATVGIYGVMTFSVAQRSHEIALRMALGATRSRVVGLVVREGVTLAAVGLGAWTDRCIFHRTQYAEHALWGEGAGFRHVLRGGVRASVRCAAGLFPAGSEGSFDGADAGAAHGVMGRLHWFKDDCL